MKKPIEFTLKDLWKEVPDNIRNNDCNNTHKQLFYGTCGMMLKLIIAASYEHSTKDIVKWFDTLSAEFNEFEKQPK